ncbi:spike base protein, RCAP_Rcc01079 family [Rhodovulum sulfidophilum]|uniref:spike base protein, RCAP_Rcc01079 family n=1 Tax=Rhodovulum sulfidophilum TaxID=35806 RepID=UPI003F86052C
MDCAVSGDVVIVSASGNEITVTLTAGAPYPVRPVRVKATGTTATGIIGMW